MDLSRQTIGEDTSAGVSMYLSFDSNSTMSSAAYKTLSDFSTFSAMEMDELHTVEEESTESHQNSTLEANESHLKTVKKAEVMPLGTAPPLRAFAKNILQEYKAISSTPTKEQLMRSVEVMRGSEVERCMDLGIAFMGMDDEKNNAFFHEENKENALPESEGSTLSTSGETVTSVIERKQMTLLSNTVADESLKANNDNNLDAEAATPTPDENIEGADVLQELPCTSGLRRPKTLNKNSRKSVCEPNLQTNRPSRIATHTKSRSSLSLSNQMGPNEIANIPKLLDKMLKISTKAAENKKLECKKESNSKTAVDGRKETAAGGRVARNSLLPKIEKRPYNVTQRMSIVVKTTLNSPARKVARKSLLSIPLPAAVAQRRRSVLNTATKTTRRSTVSVAASSRRSMLPTTITTAGIARQSGGEDQQSNTKINVRHSILPKPSSKPNKYLEPIVERAAKSKSTSSPIVPKIPSVAPKPDTSIFSCHQCVRQFRVKSLFDAHKRSHVEATPTLLPILKKVTTAANEVDAESTQCKYCDKRFAIVRALHIHLMQNCPKIPANEKRKLQFTEMNHVEKAQLPPVFSNVSSNNTVGTTTKTVTKSSSNSNNVAESSMEKKENRAIKKEAVYAQGDSQNQMQAPQLSKFNKKPAHAGVYRTPNKTVPCHLCKQSFKSILDYTNHSMAMHSTHAKDAKPPFHKTSNADPRKGLTK